MNDLNLSSIVYNIITFIMFTLLFLYLESLIMKHMKTKIVEKDGTSYVVPDFQMPSEDSRRIKNEGNKLVCESLNKILGQPIKHDKIIYDIPSIVSGESVTVDCYENKTNIAVDYLPEEIYKYDGPTLYNQDIYEFYNRLAVYENKKNDLKMRGYKYIQVPYKVDKCNKNNECKEKIPINERKHKLYHHLKKQIKNIL